MDKQLISWEYKSAYQKQKEILTKYYVENEEYAKIIKQYGFFNMGTFGNVLIPGVTKTSETGYTAKASKHGELLKNMELDEKTEKLRNFLPRKQAKFVDYADYYFFNFPSHSFDKQLTDYATKKSQHLVDSIKYDGRFIKKELFIDPDFINMLDRYLRYYSRCDKSEYIKIFEAVKIKDPDFFDYLSLTFETIKNLNIKVDISGKKAFVKTLAPGKVLLEKEICYNYSPLTKTKNAYWNGEKLQLKINSKDVGLIEIEITPNENTIVTILDESAFIPGKTGLAI